MNKLHSNYFNQILPETPFDVYDSNKLSTQNCVHIHKIQK